MRIPISEIKVNPGRRNAAPADVRELADSIAEIGLLNPITVDRGHTLIAGLHRLEAATLPTTTSKPVWIWCWISPNITINTIFGNMSGIRRNRGSYPASLGCPCNVC